MYYLTGARDLFACVIIPSIGIRLGKALVGFQMFTGMFRALAGGELIPYSGRCCSGPSAPISGVNPELRCPDLVLTFAFLEQLDRCIIHKDGLGLKCLIAGGI